MLRGPRPRTQKPVELSLHLTTSKILTLRPLDLLIVFRNIEVAHLPVRKVGGLTQRLLVTNSGIDFLPGSKGRGSTTRHAPSTPRSSAPSSPPAAPAISAPPSSLRRLSTAPRDDQRGYQLISPQRGYQAGAVPNVYRTALLCPGASLSLSIDGERGNRSRGR